MPAAEPVCQRRDSGGTWRLSERAEEDPIGIWLSGAERFGPERADRYQEGLEAAFDLLARFPELARERLELAPPMRVHPCGAHLICDPVPPGGTVFVVRVRHSCEDWTTEPL